MRLRTVRSGNVGVAFTAKVRFLRGGTIDQSCPWVDWLGLLDDVDSEEKRGREPEETKGTVVEFITVGLVVGRERPVEVAVLIGVVAVMVLVLSVALVISVVPVVLVLAVETVVAVTVSLVLVVPMVLVVALETVAVVSVISAEAAGGGWAQPCMATAFRVWAEGCDVGTLAILSGWTIVTVGGWGGATEGVSGQPCWANTIFVAR